MKSYYLKRCFLPILALFLSCQDADDGTVVVPDEQSELEAFEPYPVKQVLGVTHVGGKYHFTDDPFLIEGAKQLAELGARNIKLWLTEDSRDSYYYNSDWPEVSNLKELLETDYYKTVLEMPFETYSFVTTAFGKPNWKDGFTEAEQQHEENQFYEAARYLLTTYQHSGKTFILQNWEGDNALSIDVLPEANWPVAIEGMRAWLNARQDGILRARQEVGMNGVRVVGCAEVNFVLNEGFTMPTVIDSVVPYTHMDLYSFSSWGTKTAGTEILLLDKLDYIASKAPDSELYGAKNVMLGEFGCYEGQIETNGRISDYTGEYQKVIVKRQLLYALEWGVPWAFYWELYCNGLRSGVQHVPGKDYTNADLVGVWLIRADGSITPTYDLFKKLLAD